MRLILEDIIKTSRGLAAYNDDVEVSGDVVMSGIILEKKVCPRCRFPHLGSSRMCDKCKKDSESRTTPANVERLFQERSYQARKRAVHERSGS